MRNQEKMKITLTKYEKTGNPELLFDGVPVTVNYCHLPGNQTALDVINFPEILESLTALGICEDTGNIVKCNAGIFPVVVLKEIPEEGLEI